MSEDSLRKDIRDNCPPYVHLEWVEPFANPGVPDLNYCVDKRGEGWMELKYVTNLSDWKLSLIRPAQLQWLTKRGTMGANVYLLIKAGKDRHSWYLVKDSLTTMSNYRKVEVGARNIWHGKVKWDQLWEAVS